METYQTYQNIKDDGPVTEERTLTVVQNFNPNASNYMERFSHKLRAHTSGVPESYKVTPVTRSVLKDDTLSWKTPKNDPASFSKIRRSGAIKMSDYSVGTTNVKYHLVKDKVSWTSTGTSHEDETPPHNFGWDPPGYRVYTDKFYVQSTYSYDRIRDFRDFSSLHLIKAPEPPSFRAQVETCKSKVVADLGKKYDLLTDMAEFRSTMSTGRSLLQKVVNPLRTYRDLRRKLLSLGKGNREVASRWLEYRYGILPVILSAQDLLEMYEQRESKYQTVRSRAGVSLEHPSLRIPPDINCRFENRTGDIRINATGKARFSSPSSRLLHQTSLNLVNTAWELIPYSLVVDWFSNFGDWLYSHTSVLDNVIADQAFCLSIKRNESLEEYVQLYRPSDFRQPGGEGWPSLAYTIPEQTVHHLIRSIDTESYSRVTFKPSDVGLTFNPKFGNWKRYADAYALSLNPLRRLLRSLK